MVKTSATVLHIITLREVSSCIRKLTRSDNKLNLQNSSIFVVVINQYWWYSREVPQTLGSRRCQDRVRQTDTQARTCTTVLSGESNVYLFQRTNIQNYFCVWAWDLDLIISHLHGPRTSVPPAGDQITLLAPNGEAWFEVSEQVFTKYLLLTKGNIRFIRWSSLLRDVVVCAWAIVVEVVPLS